MEDPVPEHMLGVATQQPGGVDALELVSLRTPYPAEGEYLIKVAGAGVNRPDLLQREGQYPPPKGLSDIATRVLGLEVSGEVVIAGRNTTRFQPGDNVCALVSGGGYAEYCLVSEATTLPVPVGVNLVDAASLPETIFTVWHNVFERGALQAGEWLLVHGGASGIGATAIQLAKAFGAQVVATLSSVEKAAFCEQLGADHIVNYLEENFVDVVKEVTQGHGADVILDMIGGDYIERNIKCAAEEGRIVQIAFLNGSIAEVNFMRLMLKRLTLTGSTLRARSLEFKANLAQAIEAQVWPLFANGKMWPTVDKTFALKDVHEAHTMMEARQNMGKIVLVTS